MESDKIISTDLIQKNLEPISFFEKDADFLFIYKKTEKLASAMYMITNLFSENEPLKWTLRRKSGDLVSFIINYKDVSESNEIDLLNIVKVKVLELVSFLEIALHGGLISTMNFSILKQEFSNLLDVLNNKINVSKDIFNKPISKSFFEVEEGFNRLNNEDLRIKKTVFDSIKDKNNKDSFIKSNRQNLIIGLLKKKKELSIKDISQVIKNCSEKTIQRELNLFITKGVIKRTGVRRWSKYSLI